MTRRLLVLFWSFSAIFAAKQSWEINLEVNQVDDTVFGDMILTPAQLLRYESAKEKDLNIRGVSIKENSFNRWDNNVVPFVLSPQYSSYQKQVILSSIRYFERISCFKFTERSSENDYLFIVPLDGCYSYVGKIGGRQTVSLAGDCVADYIIWHELMHAIGFEHEHQRPDRDSFIRVDYQNVIPGQLINFDKLQASLVDFPDLYDYKSIMHYDGFAFGKIETRRKVRMATMIPLKNGVKLDDNMKFTTTDILKLNRLGQCSTGTNLAANNQVLTAECKDVAVNCEGNRRRGMCRNPFYKNMMIKSCQKTCKLCAYPRMIEEEEFVTTTTSATPSKTCSDVHPRCKLYSENGFCTLKFYEDVRQKLCAKTCNLC